MILTDKCKKMFKEYLVRLINPYTRYRVNYTVKQDGSKVQEHTVLLGQDLTENQICEWFYSQPFSMQQGVYLEFLREQGIIPVFQPEDIPNDFNPLFEVSIAISKNTGLEWHNVGFQLDYNTALTQAITKCNELINGSEK